jgi:hypothetical protein
MSNLTIITTLHEMTFIKFNTLFGKSFLFNSIFLGGVGTWSTAPCVKIILPCFKILPKYTCQYSPSEG